MNAKKIMGAVLVALLAAALFVGAGAAEETAVGTVYLYQNTSLPKVQSLPLVRTALQLLRTLLLMSCTSQQPQISLESSMLEMESLSN